MILRNITTMLFAVFFLAGCAATPTSEQLTSAQLEQVLVTNTEFGHYEHKGYDVTFSQFYSTEGKIIGSTSYGPTSGIYEIRADGCFYTDFFDDSGVADGCNYYTEIGKNEYRVDGPYDSVTNVMIKSGNRVSE